MQSPCKNSLPINDRHVNVCAEREPANSTCIKGRVEKTARDDMQISITMLQSFNHLKKSQQDDLIMLLRVRTCFPLYLSPSV